MSLEHVEPLPGLGAESPPARRRPRRLARSAHIILRNRMRLARRVRGLRVGEDTRPLPGLLWRGRLGGRQKLMLGLELGLVFFGLPLVLGLLQWLDVEVPLIPALLVITVGVWGALLLDRRFNRRQFSAWHGLGREVRRMALCFVIGSAALAGLAFLLRPEMLLSLPRERPDVWLTVMLLYPLLSVYPQELIYRVFFVHRYGRLLRSRWSTIALSALAFGFVHVLYGNWVSVVLSAVGGVIFTWTYLRTRSVLLVSLEHALYGCFIFTIGLGEYFYRGT